MDIWERLEKMEKRVDILESRITPKPTTVCTEESCNNWPFCLCKNAIEKNKRMIKRHEIRKGVN